MASRTRDQFSFLRRSKDKNSFHPQLEQASSTSVSGSASSTHSINTSLRPPYTNTTSNSSRSTIFRVRDASPPPAVPISAVNNAHYPSHTSSSPSPSPSTNDPTQGLLRLTHHIITQTQQARRLFNEKSALLDAPDKAWINNTITDTEEAAHDVAVLLESTRVEQETNNGRLGLKSRLRWALWDGQRARERRERLLLCHRSLMPVMTRLQQVSVSPSAPLRGVGSVDLETGIVPVVRRGTSDRLGKEMEKVLEPGLSPVWDSSARLQDPGMELVVPVSVSGPAPMLRNKVSVAFHSPPSSISRVQDTEEPALDSELSDLLSWRWSQGRADKKNMSRRVWEDTGRIEGS